MNGPLESSFQIKYILLGKAGALNHITIELTTCYRQLSEHEIIGYVLIFSNAQNWGKKPFLTIKKFVFKVESQTRLVNAFKIYNNKYLGMLF